MASLSLSWGDFLRLGVELEAEGRLLEGEAVPNSSPSSDTPAINWTTK
jgi:hypothetical protein